MTAREEGAPERIDPRANPLLIGQGEAVARLEAFYRSGRLPHAMILSGPRGVGKATLAFRFARWLLAQAEGSGGGGGLFGAAEPQPGLAVDPSDPVFRRAFLNTLLFTIATTLLLNLLGFGYALLIVVDRGESPLVGDRVIADLSLIAPHL